MNIKPIHPNFRMPKRASNGAGGYDLFMPERGVVLDAWDRPALIPLGFSAEVPEGHVALLLPRSSYGIKRGLFLGNTCGVIDADYRGEWLASIRLREDEEPLEWFPGDRLLQMLIVPVATPELQEVDQLSCTVRGVGGFGSTGIGGA